MKRGTLIGFNIALISPLFALILGQVYVTNILLNLEQHLRKEVSWYLLFPFQF